MDSPPPVAFSWLALGSMGRREQLLLTDQDNALVFENVPKNDYDRTKAYFLNLSGKVTEKLNEVGFEYCPAEMMASNPKWCLSVAEWKEQFDNWITNPTNEKVMLCTIFFDYNMVFGNKELVVEMTESIYKSIASHEIFLNFLGLNAIKTPPPLSFFRNFLVEAGGEHKNQFDIKARAIMPLVDAARLLILSHNLKDCNNTIFRYERLYELEPQNRDLYESCINAFKTLLRFKTLQGIRNADSGRYVDLNALSKADRLRLKTSFRPIKDIQELLLVRFGLSHLM
jgi:CBS domain-containing protein